MPLEERPAESEFLGSVVDSDRLELEMISHEDHLFDIRVTGQRNEAVRLSAHSRLVDDDLPRPGVSCDAITGARNAGTEDNVSCFYL